MQSDAIQLNLLGRGARAISEDVEEVGITGQLH